MNQILRKLYYTGIIGISLFEILNIFFIMPLPGSQEINSINFAYFLYHNRWIFRILFGFMVVTGALGAFRMSRKWVPVISFAIAIMIIYIFNFQMKADTMFKQPANLIFKTQDENTINDSSLVLGVEYNGSVKGYPIEFMTYHHQVQDKIGGQSLIITYCSVCRTGRVFKPVVNDHNEKFRLVGMDHFNAMFEDATTKSWWRQATGEAITGSLKGNLLPEVKSTQVTIRKLFELYPYAQVMQADKASETRYDSLRKFELGLSKGRLTGTDSISWGKKAWVIGIEEGVNSKAYDWNLLTKLKIINDKIGDIPVVIALSSDGQSFAAFERAVEEENFTIRNDSLFTNGSAYDFSGQSLTDPTQRLKDVRAYQEFWHSWETFHPGTLRYQ